MNKGSFSSGLHLFLSAAFFVLVLASCHRNSESYFFKNGNAKMQLGNYVGAIADFRKAVEINPGNDKAYYLKALCESMLKRPQEALADYNKVTQLNPRFPDAYLNRAFYVKEKLGDLRGAIEDYNRYIDLSKDKNVAFAYNNRGYVKLQLNDLAGAIMDIQKSLELNPNNPYAFRNRALVNIKTNNLDSACRDLQRAMDLGFTQNYGDEVEDLMKEYCNKKDSLVQPAPDAQ
jgi:tetratricopeptide (TPR) repeat protein